MGENADQMWITTHFLKIILEKRFKIQRMYGNFLSKFKLNHLSKIRGYPQLSFFILIALAKNCFFHIVPNRAKVPLY